MPRTADAKAILFALNRVKEALREKRKTAITESRVIRLGLERIQAVLEKEQRWKGIHVGGTNGKGSIIAYLSALFKLAGISHGAYTSPSFPERHNGVTINGLYCNKNMYEGERSTINTHIEQTTSWWTFSLPHEEVAEEKLTPFELDTATAFQVLNKMRVRYGIIEVGMGGETDATNAMHQKSITIISKIGLDHQEYLGNTIEEIAKVKAGIMRKGIPCVVDSSNPKEVLRVLQKHAGEIGTQLTTSSKADSFIKQIDRSVHKLESYQEQNLRCAILAFRHLFPLKEVDINALLRLDPRLPGRMEWIHARGLTEGKYEQPILVDGAHNMLGVEALSGHVENQMRGENKDKPVTWIMSQSSSANKPFIEMIQALVRPQDTFAFVEYTPASNEPDSASAALGREVAWTIVNEEDQVYLGNPKVDDALRWAAAKAPDQPIIITGSLYLIRELYSNSGIERAQRVGIKRPGRTQLWKYIQEGQRRHLSPEEDREFKQARRHWYLSPLRSSVFRKLGETGRPEPIVVEEDQRAAQRQAGLLGKKMQALKYKLNKLRYRIMELQWGELEPKLPGTIGKPTPKGTAPRKLHEMADEERKTLMDACEEQETALLDWDNHRKAYNKATFIARGHEVLPGKKWMTYEEVFGHPPRRPFKDVTRNSFTGYDEPEDEWDASLEQENEPTDDDPFEIERKRVAGPDPDPKPTDDLDDDMTEGIASRRRALQQGRTTQRPLGQSSRGETRSRDGSRPRGRASAAARASRIDSMEDLEDPFRELEHKRRGK